MDIQKIIEQALDEGKKVASQGKLATYIPELAKVDPTLIGISIHTIDGKHFKTGEVKEHFSFQSGAKVFTLARVLKDYGMNLFDKVNYEPSGDPFSSMVRLEDELGRPRNPYINSGAILICDLLPGKTPEEKVETLRDFLQETCGVPAFKMDQAIYQSEASTGYRNRAMANFLKQYDLVSDPEIAVDTYFRISSLLVSLEELSRLGLFLTNDGVDPITKERIISDRCCRTTVSLMSTCGMYDEAGRVAIEVGLPCKSAVSGTILAIVPGKMSIAVFSPTLGLKGNSVAGMKMLGYLSDQMDLSIF